MRRLLVGVRWRWPTLLSAHSLWAPLCVALLAVVYCEFVCYFVVLGLFCRWPSPSPTAAETAFAGAAEQSPMGASPRQPRAPYEEQLGRVGAELPELAPAAPLYLLLLADPHLLGNRHGHWFDKLRR